MMNISGQSGSGHPNEIFRHENQTVPVALFDMGELLPSHSHIDKASLAVGSEQCMALLSHAWWVFVGLTHLLTNKDRGVVF